jgi:hypothetical protein
MGGGKFVVLLNGLFNSQAAESLAEKILEVLGHPKKLLSNLPNDLGCAIPVIDRLLFCFPR